MFFLQLAGFPGSGKSTLAHAIARSLDCIIVDHDVTKTPMLTSGIDAKLLGKMAYDVDFSLVDFYLAQQKSVILDSPCLYEEIIARGMALARKHNAHYKYVACTLDDFDEINRRLQSRVRMPSQIAAVASPDVLRIAQQHEKRPNSPILTVHTSAPLETYIDDVLAYLQQEK